MVIFLCNIPYLFFPGKSAVLNAVMEYKLCVFSRKLEAEIHNNSPKSLDEYTCFDDELPD